MKNHYDKYEWVQRNVTLGSFHQENVEVPASWSQTATNILASKYFRGDEASRESSLKEVLDRVVDTIAAYGRDHGYSLDDDFEARLKSLTIEQKFSFNSPVWFNIGVKGVSQQASACFVLSVEDDMSSILNWYVEEGIIFKGGSGAGVNLSAIRGSNELLVGGGTASGPVSFMRGADASAGTIKSGGKTRRAAKMVILDIDHPDIEEFIWCKAKEEKKARVLSQAGFDMGLNGSDSFSVQYQNANNSVWVADEFMRAVEEDKPFDLINRKDGSINRSVSARDLLNQIASAAWECGDPGIAFVDTINEWNTCPSAGQIEASNPCGEFLHQNNSACNLGSINIAKFVVDGKIAIVELTDAVEDIITAMDILVDLSDYPTDKIAKNSKAYRPLGLGVTNLAGALLESGVAYDSDEGRQIAARIMAVITATAWKHSSILAKEHGTFAGYQADKETVKNILAKHTKAASELADRIIDNIYEDVLICTDQYGVRNSMVSLIAPTGTISFLLDCESTGIEPIFSLQSTKQLVGGGEIVGSSPIAKGLQALGYSDDTVLNVLSYLETHGTLIGSEIKPEHLDVFSCASGDNAVSAQGHLKMMAAIQPLISSGISKTINVAGDSSVEDIMAIYIDAWKRGLKSVTIYRDGSKVDQPMVTQAVQAQASVNGRKKLPRTRKGRTYSFRVGNADGYVSAGEYADGSLGEIFIKVSKQGSTLAGILDALAISVSMGLQYGVPLESYVRQYTGMRFEPAGITDDDEMRFATSLIDYIFRKLAKDYLDIQASPALDKDVVKELEAPYTPEHTDTGQTCMSCGGLLIRSGACMVCTTCGTTTGCS